MPNLLPGLLLNSCCFPQSDGVLLPLSTEAEKLSPKDLREESTVDRNGVGGRESETERGSGCKKV